jgi:hypothetical protein
MGRWMEKIYFGKHQGRAASKRGIKSVRGKGGVFYEQFDGGKES